MNEPTNWLSQLNRAVWILLLAVVVVAVAQALLRRALVMLLAIAALLFVYRLALNGRHRGGW